jgi:dTDP-glucose pyrophosphorylase
MFIIIPIGVNSNNINNAKPKPLQNVLGKSIIEYLLDNLNTENITKVFIPYDKELKNYFFEDYLKNKYKHKKINFDFFVLNQPTKGPLDTILKLLNNINEEEEDRPIINLDCDNFYKIDIIKKWNGENKIFLFEDHGDDNVFSFVKTKNNNNINNLVENIEERNRISNLACTGAYGFKSWKQLKNIGNNLLENQTQKQNKPSNSKFYISSIIKELIKTENVKCEIISNNNYICLGNQFHIRLFCSNYSNINNINKINNTNNINNKKTFCFELDNTLFTNPEIEDDYTTVKPIFQNINILKSIKNYGHKIIIHTSRNLNKNLGKITFETLEKYEIQFDEIYFGKPNADFYIDYRNINSYNNLERELGFYNDAIEPRYFNEIELNQIEIYKKTSDDLRGQIMYYLNIPNELKCNFPFFLNYDYQDYKWYNMEKINGVSVSKLYIAEELTTPQFLNILDTISKIHQFNKNTNVINNIPENINIYKNYSDKLKKRYDEYDYSKYNNNNTHQEYYNKIYNKLKIYEQQKEGILSIIHGDPVFTNIIINRFNQIKLIDMRGSVDEQITIYGDELYDWAKIYQSLIGYDEILDNIEVNFEYRQEFINIFSKYINKLYDNNPKYLENIKLITLSLLFSLIPLHDNNLSNCIKFYNLLEKIY